MSYDIEAIANSTHLVPFSQHYRINDFDSGGEEYNQFLIENAENFQEHGVSNTQLLIDNKTGDVIGYFSLCMSSIRLTNTEKEDHEIDGIEFNSIPSLKIGKLAVDLKYRKINKGYGSFLIELVRGIAVESNDNGIACRFITVDADIQYDNKLPTFYTKNGFRFNESIAFKPKDTTVSMRLDIFGDIEEFEQTGTI